MEYTSIYTFADSSIERKIIGPNNKHLNLLAEEFRVHLIDGFSEIKMSPYNEAIASKIINVVLILSELVKRNVSFGERDVISIANTIDTYGFDEILNLYTNKLTIVNTYEGKAIYPKTINQLSYINALKQYDLVFSIGPAGTGKTYLAVLYAISLLKSGRIKKIVLTRPAVEAGEKLGFLPGDLKEKVDPYLIPIYDALYEGLGKETTEKLIEKGNIEIAPLAYMRGRTLDNSFVILDEAQNTTRQQMKMFLTRLGFNSKMVITGDITQIDLPNRLASGLVEAIELLNELGSVKIVSFNKHDVMRHPIVQKIIEKYEGFENGH
ncbi:MAG TPA: PhoH family protein [Bacilli bacterium]|nr:PhoH family protein [Bacilli bacterium]